MKKTADKWPKTEAEYMAQPGGMTTCRRCGRSGPVSGWFAHPETGLCWECDNPPSRPPFPANSTTSAGAIEAAVNAELRVGDRRSAVYRQAMIDVLQFRLNGVPMSAPYGPGTVEFDARMAGIDRGHLLYRKLQGKG